MPEAFDNQTMRAGYVAIVGRPNAGKSTLLNRIIGAKNYTNPAAQVVFVDTPGIHRPLHRMNVRMVDAAVDSLKEVDAVVFVHDASTRSGRGDEYVANLLRSVDVPIILALNKIDLVKKSSLLPMIEQLRRWARFADIVPISATTGDGVDALEKVLIEKMPEGDALYPDDFLTDQPERTLVAETVREKVLHHTRDELPFSTAVVVDQFEEPDRPGGLMRLYCTILVESESQKPIVIGRAGSMIKRIGTEAREDIERFFQCKVFLDLRVKVRANWRDDERTLDRLGLPQKKHGRSKHGR